jgi:hypothetical protein
MTIDEAIRIIKIVLVVAEEFEITVQGEEFTKEKCKEAVEIVTKALEPEPCTDAISRQAVLDLPRIKTHNHWGNVIKESVDIEDVRQLPPVTPTEKVGKWKRISMDKYSEHAKYWYRCDRCGEDNLGNTNYCPNCGQRKMQEVEE